MKNTTWTKQTILAGTAIAALVIGCTASAAEPENNPSDPAATSNTPPAVVRHGGFGGYDTQPGTLQGSPLSPPFAGRTNTGPMVRRSGMNAARTNQNRPPNPVVVLEPLPLPNFPARTNHAAPQGFSARRNYSEAFEAARGRMVTNQIAAPGRGIANRKILDAMMKVPRHNFVPAINLSEAYEDKPLDTGYGRLLESPYLVASVADQLDPKPTDRVLEIGTGPGYLAAVLSVLVNEVYTIDTNAVLVHAAEVNLQRTGCTNVFVRSAELAQGWPEAAPFDAIVVNDNPEHVAAVLKNQLKEGGRIVFAGAQDGHLYSMKKSGSQVVQVSSRPVRLSPAAANNVELPAVRAATPIRAN